MNKEEFKLKMKERNPKAFSLINFDEFTSVNKSISYNCENCNEKIYLENARSLYNKTTFKCQNCTNENNIKILTGLLNNLGLKILDDNIFKKEVFTVTDKVICYIEDDKKCKEYLNFKGAKICTTINRLKNKTKPLPIHNSNPYTLYNIGVYIKNKNLGCELLSSEYIDKKTLMDFRCSCGNLFKTRWNTFSTSNKVRCDKCAKLEGVNNRIKTNIIKSGSFQDILYSQYGDNWKGYWDFEKNNILPSELSSTTNKKVWLKCENKDYHIYEVSCISFKNGTRCGFCAGKKVHEKDSFYNVFPEYARYWSDKNKVSPKEIFHGTNEKYWFICPKGKHEDNFKNVREIARGKCICTECYKESLCGENSYNWKGGISTLNSFLRTSIEGWKREIMRKYNYKCDITNVGRDFEVHHMVGFAKIVNEFVTEYNVLIKENIGEYKKEELNFIRNKFIEYHNKKAEGVLLSKNIHRLFHSLYGKDDGNNTPEQYYEFKEKCKNKEIEYNF